MVKLMLALDVMDKNKALTMVDEISKYIDAIKIGYPLVLSSGLDIVKEIKDKTNKEVICDFKVADIPSTNEKIAKLTLNYADGIICHGFVGRDSVEAIQKIAKQYEIKTHHKKKVIMVTEMSHPGAVEFMQPIADKLAEVAKILNVDGIVAPSTRPERLTKIKKIVGNIPIISPGIGAQGGELNAVLDILGEDDYIIVGRAIYKSENPKESAYKYSMLLKGHNG
ncbi:orotidine-5'-phosphate decarboxylase [Methanothermococcus okinawensis]|uniref:Orotidine 5'-phosphate decarboxylase n=1 Tax=Methanothermococcus okinawensis (strain DSM 14208 / JCM 11175 / IH1) TaxID=647113 RepID=F8AK33_METOI|nr:orotidine-5'-phosphate decarboxylase [Methanothermococcus okinawensis]AEH07400.1 orotidine 5'-phosphate decarboxylase [Methanothermococcus okinawensis IH1]